MNRFPTAALPKNKKSKVSSAGGSGSQVSKRSSNWTKDENSALVNAVEPHFSKLFGKFSNKISNEMKQNLWTSISTQVNAVGSNFRQVDQIKAHWTDVKSRTKAKASGQLRERGKTGGGEVDLSSMEMDVVEEKLDFLTTVEKKIVRLNGKEWLLGIEGGIDSGETTPPPEVPPTTLALIDETQDHGVMIQEVDFEFPVDGEVIIPQETPSTPKQPKPNRIKREASQISCELLETEKANVTQLTRIACALEELVRLNKYSQGLNPMEDFPLNNQF